VADTDAIGKAWELFAKAAVPEHAPQAQRQAMYMAFIAGCDTIIQLEETVRDRGASHRVRTAFLAWSSFVKNELRRIGMKVN
jgi:hypothetical protein